MGKKRRKAKLDPHHVSKAEMAVSADMIATPNINTPNVKSFINNSNRKYPYNIYYFSELVGVAGTDTDGRMIGGQVERPLFGLSIEDREDIFKRSDIILGITTNRMNRMAGLEWNIEKTKTVEDKIVNELKIRYEHFREFADPGAVKDSLIRKLSLEKIKQVLPDVKDDLSNFDNALLRWSRKLKLKTLESCQEIKDWLNQPNNDDNFSQFIKKWVHDMMIHGSGAVFKELRDRLLTNLYPLPGGTMIPLKSKFIGGSKAYIQTIQGMDGKIFFQNEVSITNYIPVSGWSSAFVPLEALVNKVAEGLLFDQLMAERADGTAPPQKAVIFGQRFGFGGLDSEEGFDVPLPVPEQKRLETTLSEPRKGAIRVLSGVGQPLVLDLSKSDTIQYNMQRQKDILRNAALVFNMTPLEVNLTGGDDTSGRNTSESQEQREKEEGIYPLALTFEEMVNTDFLPVHSGPDFYFSFKTAMSEDEKLKLITAKMQTGCYAVNEIRMEEGLNPFDKDEFNFPASKTAPDGSEQNPLNTKAIGA